jgi:putative FmdB family regulatory protein
VPLYEYECQRCKRKTERIESVSGPHLRKCPHCGGKVEQLLAPPALQFKGSGWYVTDYAGKSAASEAANAKPGVESKETGAKDTSAKESASKEKKASKKK